MEYFLKPTKARILVVDDEDAVREILDDFLSFEGFEVVTVGDSEQALQRILSEPFDLVLTDLEMPGKNGLDFLRELKQLKDPPTAIMMTGYGTVESAIEAMKMGAYDYILKPFQIEELTHLIQKALEHRRLEAENLRLQETVALFQLSEEMNQARSTQEIAQILAQTLFEQFEPDLVCVWRLEEGRWHLVAHRSAPEAPDDALEVVSGFDSVALLKAFHDDYPLLLDRHTTTIYFAGDDEVSFRSAVIVPMRVGDRVTGMVGVFSWRPTRTFTEGHRKTLQLYADRAAVSSENVRLYENLERTFLQTIESLVGALEAKDEYTKGHSERVAQWAVIIGELMGLDADQLEDLRRAGLLHDIGKIGLNLDSLNKPTPLTPEEYERFKLHPVLGKKILEPVEFLQGAIPAVLHHHEHWDGGGYPLGLAGEEIPLGARILGIADAFEVMITDRVYRSALPLSQAIAELRRCAGSQFDPQIVERFTAWLERFPDLDSLPVKGGRRTDPERAAAAEQPAPPRPFVGPSEPVVLRPEAQRPQPEVEEAETTPSAAETAGASSTEAAGS